MTLRGCLDSIATDYGEVGPGFQFVTRQLLVLTWVIDLSRIPTNNGTKSRLGWTKMNVHENVHPNLTLVLLFKRTEVECGKGLFLDAAEDITHPFAGLHRDHQSVASIWGRYLSSSGNCATKLHHRSGIDVDLQGGDPLLALATQLQMMVGKLVDLCYVLT